MKQLRYDDLRELSGVLPEVYAHTDLATLPRFTADVVRRFVVADLIEYNEVAPDRCILTQRPTSPEGCRRFSEFKVHLDKHPLSKIDSSAGATRVPVRLDAEVGTPACRINHQFYRLIGIADQLAFGFQGQVEAWVNIVLNRWNRTFNSRDQLFVDFLQPHLAQAYRNAAALAESQQKSDSLSGAFASMHRGLVMLNPQGDPLWMTKTARDWLANYFPEFSTDRRLPKRLLIWISDRRAWQQRNPRLGLPEPLTISRPDSRLIVRYSEDSRGRQFLFLKEEKIGVCPFEFVRLGLTRREGEVLYWICQGKSNPEIASVQGISHRTVHKHVEHILAKLNVETRAAAMLTALDALDESDTPAQEG